MFKGLFGKKDGKGGGGRGPKGGTQLSMTTQRRLARGVDCNMKIPVRGDRNTGKSCLLKLLQGEPFSASYIPTPQIEVANISWTYKATDDIVKVEVWDVVDIGTRKTAPSTSLKLGEEAPAPEETANELPCLDATLVDVYKGAHGAIFVFDITKNWTFEYVQREIEKVPKELPVLVLGNFRDKGEHRAVESMSVTYWIESLDRFKDDEAGDVLYAESALANGFGLMYAYRFFNLPYLILQRQQLKKRMEINAVDIAATKEELTITGIGTREQDYEQFVSHLKSKRGKKKKSQSAADAEEATRHSPPLKANSTGGIGPASATGSSDASSRAASPTEQPAEDGGTKKKGGFFKRSSSSSSAKKKVSTGGGGTPIAIGTGETSVDDFVPDTAGVDDFFGTPARSDIASPVPLDELSSDDDDADGGNGLVAMAGSDIEFSDQDDDGGGGGGSDGDDDGGGGGASALLASPDEGEMPEAAAADDDDSDDDGPALADSSDEELPDGWVDPAVSEAIAKKKDAEREERMKKVRAMQKKQAEERAAEEKFRAEAFAVQEAAAAAGGAGSGDTEYDDLDSAPTPALTSAEKAAIQSPNRPSSTAENGAEATVPTTPKTRGGLSFAAYAPPSPVHVIVPPPQPGPSGEEEIPENETEEEKKEREKRAKKAAKKAKREAKEAERAGATNGDVESQKLEEADSDMLDSWLGPDDAGGGGGGGGGESEEEKKARKKKEKKAKAKAKAKESEGAGGGGGGGGGDDDGEKKKKKKKKKEKKEKGSVAYDEI